MRRYHRSVRLESLETRLAPAVATWDGGGSDNNWTTPANWIDDVAPQPGDNLTFPTGAARLTNTNDFPAGTEFVNLNVATGYVLNGNAIALPGGVTAEPAVPNAGGNATVNLD